MGIFYYGGEDVGKRSAFFIDGYNLYHSLDSAPRFRRYKWLDLRKLALGFSVPPYEELRAVRYFTAFADWRPASSARHRMYVSALETVGVETILGRFQEKQLTCRAPNGCGKTFLAHEEKMTDVNIAVSIVESCVADRFDVIYLVSGDNDLVPALEAVRRLSSKTKITVVLPIGARAKG